MAAAELNNTVLKDNANLKAYYRFEASALTTDSSGNSKTLTNNNTVAEGTGVYGGCADFTAASSQYFSTSGNIGISGNGARSVVFWVKSSTAARMEYVGWGAGSTNAAFVLGSDSSSEFYVIAYGANDINTTYPMNTGSWIHVAVTHDGTNTRLYFNGQYHSTYARTYNTTDSVLNIGRQIYADAGPQYYYLNGSIDDLAIFSTALSADQIKELYEGRFIGEAYPQAGLVAGWHLNGGSTDFSGNNNHGTDTAITYSQANGKFGQGAGFNGSTSSVNFTKSNAALFDINTFTICGWANTPVGGGGTFFANYYRPSDITGYITYLGSTISFNVHKNASPSFKSTVANIDVRDGKWHHYAFVKSSTNYQDIYLDGNLVEHDTTDLYDANLWTNAVLNIGNRNGGEVPYTGKMDEILFFNRILTSQEIRRMYAVGVGKLQ